jgi:membrane protein required for colicin V production
MNWLDVILLLIFAASTIGSFRKGLSRQIIHLASVVLGILLGIWFYGTAAAHLAPYLSSRAAANLCGFLIVFFGVLLLGGIVSWIVGKFLRVTGLSIVDHLLGAGFGLLRGILVAVALIMGVMAFSKDGRPPRAVDESRIAPYVSKAANVLVAMAPNELKEGFRKTYAQAKEVWSHTVKNGIHTAPEAERKK